MPFDKINLLLPADAPARLCWAMEELLARVGVAYRLIDGPHDRAPEGIVLAIDCQLPQGRPGLRLGGPDAMDAMALARRVADGTAGELVQPVGEGQLALPVDLADTYEEWIGRREEYDPSKWDHANRIRFQCHALTAVGLGQAPLAELLADVVHEALARLAGQTNTALAERRSPWPGGAKFACHLSHDVDTIGGRYQMWRRYAMWGARYVRDRLAGRESAQEHLGRIRRWWNEPGDPHYCVPKLLELEGKYGATSTFYFFCNRTASTRGQKASRMYRIQDKLPRQAVSLIVRNGWEAGVHGTYCTHTDARVMAEHRRRLEKIAGEQIVGIRQHYLHLAVPETWRAQQQAGFAYDATLGWNFDVGLRAATCRPFQIWDCRQQCKMGLYELPMTHQDAALGLRFGPPETWLAGLSDMLGRIENVGGAASILLHPNRMDGVDFPGQPEFYEDLLGLLKGRGAFVRSGRDIIAAEVDHRRFLAED
jgi:hypothetical protein